MAGRRPPRMSGKARKVVSTRRWVAARSGFSRHAGLPVSHSRHNCSIGRCGLASSSRILPSRRSM
ncbi:hypothetical protein ABMX48_13565 [Streptomyces cavourensis]